MTADQEGMEIITQSTDETVALGRRIGKFAQAGQCIALEGMLGTGKTQLVRGISLGAAVADIGLVNSPSYVLLNIYEAVPGNPQSKTVYHLDAYRVKNSDAFAAVGFSELLEQEGIVAIEWASRISDLLPEDHLLIQGDTLDDTTRRWRLIAHGPRSLALAAAIIENWGNRQNS